MDRDYIRVQKIRIQKSPRLPYRKAGRRANRSDFLYTTPQIKSANIFFSVNQLIFFPIHSIFFSNIGN